VKDMDLVSVFPATFVEKVIFAPSYVFDAFVKNQVGIGVPT
jgi:hypothetical protein